MKITLVQIGKTDDLWIQEGLRIYAERLKHYTSFSVIEIPALKNTRGFSPQQQNEKEGELILKNCSGAGRIYLLDEGGKEYGSVEFSKFLQLQMNSSVRHLFFVIGGPF
ncbi:MAG TPA: 23S rRNA (pseudouridine(1915)-N(3))-methyltransferase RlmH, partial [Bacteroidia bacterium]|nr:23S rRNA (pseudouridine(1915)-N(3))-methyltransferase RlmH [Bacteroidia bacterium]